LTAGTSAHQIHIAIALAMPKPLEKSLLSISPFDKLEETVKHCHHPHQYLSHASNWNHWLLIATTSAAAIATTCLAVVFAYCLHLLLVDCQYFAFILLSFAAVIVAAHSAVMVVC